MGLSAQQPGAGHLAGLQSKARGLRERRAAEGWRQHHLWWPSWSLPFGTLFPRRGVVSPAAPPARRSKCSSCVPPASNPAPVWGQESCRLWGPSTVAAALMGSDAVSSKGAPVGLACWKVTLARPPRLLCFHPHEIGFHEEESQDLGSQIPWDDVQLKGSALIVLPWAAVTLPPPDLSPESSPNTFPEWRFSLLPSAAWS